MTNQYGLDAHYFKKKLKKILEGVDNYTPKEVARALVRLACTADENEALKEVLLEHKVYGK